MPVPMHPVNHQSGLVIGTGVDLLFLSMPHAHYTYGILQEGGARQAPFG